MHRSSRLPTAFAALALLTAACGDGPTATSGDPLTEAEVMEIAQDVFNGVGEMFSGNIGPQRSAVLPAGLHLSIMAPVPFNVTVNESGPCEGGGTASVSGSIEGSFDDQTGAGDVGFDVTQDAENCVITGATHSYTVSGDPDLHLTGSFETDGGTTFSGSFSLVGGLSFEVNDGRTGTCGVDVTVTVSATGTSFSGTVSGTMCGVTLNNEVSFGGE
jgi:hypothetical protein